MRVLRDVGAEIPKEMDQFPSTIKKKGKHLMHEVGIKLIYKNTEVMELSTGILPMLPRLPRSLLTRFTSHSLYCLIYMYMPTIFRPGPLQGPDCVTSS